jgi:hypothetical protein
MKNAVIIGSGLAGTLVGNELSKAFKVTILEAGPKNSIQYPSVQFINKDFGLVKTFCRGGGGTTNLWHNGLMPINPGDVHSVEFKEVLTDARSFVDEAASKLFFVKKKYDCEYEALSAQMTTLKKGMGIFPEGLDFLLYPKQFKRLTIDSGTEAYYGVRDFSFGEGEGKINRINYRLGNKKYSLEPDLLFICAGTLGTPNVVGRLLADTGHSFDRIGTGLVDHPMGFIGKIKVKKTVSILFERLATLNRGDYICRSAVRLRSECGKYSACAFFRPALTMGNNLSLYKYKSLLGASSGIERFRSALSLKLFHPDILAEIYSHLFKTNFRSRIYGLLVIFEQKQGKNRVTYEGDKIKVDWGISEAELDVYNNLLKKLKDMLEDLAEDLVVRVPLTDDWLWSAAHHSGTMLMGSLPDGIIDTNLKINFFDNVFVCDGSVIQEHSYANTGLTIGQLALRLVNRITLLYN